MQAPKIVYLFRKRMPHFHSVEGVFSVIVPLIAREFPVKSVELPYAGGVISVFRNLWGFRKERGVLYHLTGQDCYISLLTGRKSVLTIHDVGSALKGLWYKRIMVLLFWLWIPALLVRRITVISENSAREVRALMPFSRHKIRVIPNPVSPLFAYTPKPFQVVNP
ncbi:MAG: glycosyltransferase, partial [Bacteroidales bacterium]